MKRQAVSLLLLALAAGMAHAGEAPPWRCSKSTQTCLDHMAGGLKRNAWIGVELEPRQDGRFQVGTVLPGSPAARAGVKSGDILQVLDGVDVSGGQEEILGRIRNGWRPGQETAWTVLRGRSKKKMTLHLVAMPADMMARYIGLHMLCHVTPDSLVP